MLESTLFCKAELGTQWSQFFAAAQKKNVVTPIKDRNGNGNILTQNVLIGRNNNKKLKLK
jgi:hypothetical protein